MPLAARITDMHVCPLVNPGGVPHTGGPVLPPGKPAVLIGGMPAATVGPMSQCSGHPDVLTKGSHTGFIGGLPAATLGEVTDHEGSDIAGWPNRMIRG